MIAKWNRAALSTGLLAVVITGCGAQRSPGTSDSPSSECAHIRRVWATDVPGDLSNGVADPTAGQVEFEKASTDLAAAANQVSQPDLRAAVQGLAAAYGKLASAFTHPGADGRAEEMNAMSVYVKSAQAFTQICGT